MKFAAFTAIIATALACSVTLQSASASPKKNMHNRYFYLGSVKADYTTTKDSVILGGTPILTYRVGADGYTPHDRAVEAQERFNQVLGIGPIYASDITTQMQGDDAVVLVKGRLLFDADPASAAVNGCEPIDLANTWADHMRQVLPPLTAAN